MKEQRHRVYTPSFATLAARRERALREYVPRDIAGKYGRQLDTALARIVANVERRANDALGIRVRGN